MKIGIAFLTLFLWCFSIAVGAQTPPVCKNLKVTTLPAPGDFGGAGRFSVVRQTIVNPEPDAPAPVSVFLPSNATPTSHVPVIFFAHGFGGTDYQYYEALLRQLASNGYAVVFSPYTANLFSNHATRYQQLWRGFQAAVERHDAVIDQSRVGFAGHSYGAGAVPEMARRAVVAGWGGRSLFLFSAAPWYSWGTNYEQIPASAKLVVQVYWDDETNQHLIGQNDIWNRLPQIAEKRWQVIRAARANCLLPADHGVTVTGISSPNEINALDYWGVWRRIHALADYTFTDNQAAKPVAFGDDARMGRWRNVAALRFVTPLEATTTPVVNNASNPDFTWANRCVFAQGSPCP